MIIDNIDTNLCNDISASDLTKQIEHLSFYKSLNIDIAIWNLQQYHPETVERQCCYRIYNAKKEDYKNSLKILEKPQVSTHTINT